MAPELPLLELCLKEPLTFSHHGDLTNVHIQLCEAVLPSFLHHLDFYEGFTKENTEYIL